MGRKNPNLPGVFRPPYQSLAGSATGHLAAFSAQSKMKSILSS
jgi:hypothetical protein